MFGWSSGSPPMRWTSGLKGKAVRSSRSTSRYTSNSMCRGCAALVGHISHRRLHAPVTVKLTAKGMGEQRPSRGTRRASVVSCQERARFKLTSISRQKRSVDAPGVRGLVAPTATPQTHCGQDMRLRSERQGNPLPPFCQHLLAHGLDQSRPQRPPHDLSGSQGERICCARLRRYEAAFSRG
jgi:hypothetical protein